MDDFRRFGVQNFFHLYNFIFNNEEESSDEDEDVLDVHIAMARRRVTLERRNPVRILHFVNETVPRFTDQEFQSHFRMSPIAFEWLLNRISPDLQSAANRHVITPQKQLLALLWLLATPDSYRSVGLTFDMGKSSLFHCFIRVIKALNRIAPEIITWPTGQRKVRVMEGFRRMARIRGIVGAIDGTYVPIKAPQEDPDLYINRKCFHGITLQAICDNLRKFTDCFTGYPSSVSDIRIFRNSDIYHEFDQHPKQYFEHGQYIIGDKAYPVTRWCLPPYIQRRPLQDWQRNFNTQQARTRQVIERTFALLFGRFRRLRYLDMNRIDLIPSTIIAACVLHNICLEHPDNFVQMYEQEGLPFVQGENEGVMDNPDYIRNGNEGNNQRDALARELYRQ